MRSVSRAPYMAAGNVRRPLDALDTVVLVMTRETREGGEATEPPG